MKNKFNILFESYMSEISELEQQYETPREEEREIGTYTIEHYTINFLEYTKASGEKYYQYLIFQDNDPKALNFELNTFKTNNISELVESAIEWLFDWSDYINETYDINQCIDEATKTITI